MKKFLHLFILISAFLVTGIVLSQSSQRGIGVTRSLDDLAIAENKEEGTVYYGEDFFIFNVAPNPADEYIEIQYSVPAHITNLRFEIRNILGNVVFPPRILPPNERSFKISTRNLDPGIYFHSLYLDNKSLVTRKLIIKR